MIRGYVCLLYITLFYNKTFNFVVQNNAPIMNASLSQKEMGRRIAALRKFKGLSQKELAQLIEISRPALTQMEGGNRGIDVFELHRIVQTLGFSLDHLMASDFSLGMAGLPTAIETPVVGRERISIPELQESKLKQVLLYVLEHCAGKPNVGERMLHNLLYFCDFNHYEVHEEHLTGASYIKLSSGPVMVEFDAVVQRMLDDQQLKRIKTEYYGLVQTRYLPLVKADLRQLLASEKETMDRVIETMSDGSATSLGEYALMDMPCRTTQAGEVLDYELVFYREAPFTVRNYGEEQPNP